jgi:hypothetical protein
MAARWMKSPPGGRRNTRSDVDESINDHDGAAIVERTEVSMNANHPWPDRMADCRLHQGKAELSVVPYGVHWN